VCGWEEAACDGHHIRPVGKGGKNALANVIVLCPNHHRLADVGKLTEDDLRATWERAYGSLSLPPGLL
jgi:predicted restriction endonuclease